MANFCTNCGAKLGHDYKFCTNCGAKVDGFDMRDDSSFKSMPDSEEVKKAKKELKRVIGGRLSYNKAFLRALADNGIDTTATRIAIRQQVNEEIESGQIRSAGVEIRVNQLIAEYKIHIEREREEERKRLKLIDEILESDEITSEIIKSKSNQMFVSSIKDDLKEKLIREREIASEDEIRQFIKSELERLREEEKKARIKAKQAEIPVEMKASTNEVENGGYCGYTCIHFIEEYISSDGEIDYDFTGSEIIDYYCTLGHYVAYGSFCKYHETSVSINRR